ncbi:hypothetical protein SAMN05444421_10846 [Celeribacter marinus]|nr:hypothetical protein SAMN05444421_10846 [Celeribacter marinus]
MKCPTTKEKIKFWISEHIGGLPYSNPASHQQLVIPDTCVSFPLQTRALTVQNMDR